MGPCHAPGVPVDLLSMSIVRETRQMTRKGKLHAPLSVFVLLSLTPGFSRVFERGITGAASAAFSTRGRKPLKRFCGRCSRHTRLKPGANESRAVPNRNHSIGSGWNGPLARCGGRPARRSACACDAPFRSDVCRAETRRQVAAENGPVAHSTRNQRHRSMIRCSFSL